MDNQKPLSNTLEELGFVCVYDTKERLYGRLRSVRRGPARHWGHKNNIEVVFDHVGRPWVRFKHLPSLEIVRLGFPRYEGHIPHSLDWGDRLFEIFPSNKFEAPRIKPHD